jgi:hypothetical protein
MVWKGEDIGNGKQKHFGCTLWGNRFGRGCGPVALQTTKWMNTFGRASPLAFCDRILYAK